MSSLDKYNIRKKNKHYLTPLKTIREIDEFSSKNTKNKKIFLDLSNIKPNKDDSIDNYQNNSNNIYNIKNTNRLKLPILDTKNISRYTKMKQYKVLLPKHRDKKKEMSFEEQEEKVENLLNKYVKTSFKGNKYLIDDNISKKYDFDSYLKLQSAAEIKFKPKFGDNTLLLVNYINKVSNIRKKIVDDLMDDIENKTEKRYNLEKPNVDFKFRSRDKYLIDNRWKNTFSLDEYQKYFIKNLKGKISDMSYLNMVKKFQRISHICFSEGNLGRNEMKRLDNVT